MTATGTEARVCKDIAARQRVGIEKYGTTVEGNPLPPRAWIEHAYQEALDLAVYLRRWMDQFDDLEGEVDAAIELDALQAVALMRIPRGGRPDGQ